jgi:hypothetical protein
MGYSPAWHLSYALESYWPQVWTGQLRLLEAYDICEKHTRWAPESEAVLLLDTSGCSSYMCCTIQHTCTQLLQHPSNGVTRSIMLDTCQPIAVVCAHGQHCDCSVTIMITHCSCWGYSISQEMIVII